MHTLAVEPAALAADEPGKEILNPVAIVIVGGLVSSTLLGLLVTPALYYRFGRKPFLVASALLMGTGQAGLCLARDPAWLLSFSFLSGIAAAFIYVNFIPFLAEFVPYLADVVHITPSTIKTYLSAVRSLHIDRGWPDPLQVAPLMQRVLSGVKRVHGMHPASIDYQSRVPYWAASFSTCSQQPGCPLSTGTCSRLPALSPSTDFSVAANSPPA